MNTLVHLPNVTNDEDTKALRSLFDSFKSNIRNLENLKINLNLYGSLLGLIPIVKVKLPRGIKLILNRTISLSEGMGVCTT